MAEVIQLQIPDNENEGIELISFVDRPAHELQWVVFGEDSCAFAANIERGWVTGVAMIPNRPIYRNTNGVDWFAIFTADDITDFMLRFMSAQNGDAVNINHQAATKTKGAYLIESFQVDSSRGVSAPTALGSKPDGTWIVTYKITDPKILQKVKSGEITGFSVEGVFKTKDLGAYDSEVIKQLNNLINQ